MDIAALPVVYLSLLLGLLAIAGWVIFRQVLKTRQVENSLSRLQQKLTKEKGTAEEYYELGSIYLDKRLYVQAIELFQRSLKASEGSKGEFLALVYNALGFAYFAQEQYDLSIRQYKEALKEKPDYITALNNLGHAYERKQLTAAALESYESVLKQDPQNTTAKRRADSLRKRLTPA